jgi:hypothetical protein
VHVNRKIRAMIEEVERRGGALHVSDSLPDDLAEAFLEQVLACPDCRARADAGIPDEVTIDKVLGGVVVPGRMSGH